MRIQTIFASDHWLQRIQTAFTGILVFSDGQGPEGITHKAQSVDGRVLLACDDRNGALIHASLQLALPEPHDLEIIKDRSVGVGSERRWSCG